MTVFRPLGYAPPPPGALPQTDKIPEEHAP
jgi:hypothetical protein